MSISSADVRKFILSAFSDEELEGLCFDYFQEVENYFSSGMSKEDKARRLIEYCQRRGRIADLFTALKAERPIVFAQSFQEPLPAQLDDIFPDSETVVMTSKEIQVSEVIADRLISEGLQSMRVFTIYLAGLVVVGILVIASGLLLPGPFRQINLTGGLFICSLGAIQVRGIIGRREQKSRCETIKTILDLLKQGQGGVDASTWQQIQSYLWGEMNKPAPGKRVLL